MRFQWEQNVVHSVVRLAFALGMLLVVCAVGGHESRAGDPKTVRLAVVNTPQFSGLIDALLPDFTAETGYAVTVVSGTDVYDRARAGEADIVIFPYGKAEVERFVLDGFGRWPRMVFSNQLVLIGQRAIRPILKDFTSATEAFRKIAATKSPFVPNALPGITYLTDVLWHSAGEPDKQGWFLEATEMKGRAIGFAEEKGAYVIWGALPFLRYKGKHSSEMEVMVSSDPLLHRVMASIIVNPEKIAGINSAGAEALQKYLLSAKTQARLQHSVHSGATHSSGGPPPAATLLKGSMSESRQASSNRQTCSNLASSSELCMTKEGGCHCMPAGRVFARPMRVSIEQISVR